MNKIALRYDSDSQGSWNMALDEWLLLNKRPTLRFYGWEPATLSLGYFQPHQEVKEEELLKRGFSLVRRLTGGKAVLHHREITYSLIAPTTWFPGPLVNSYNAIGLALKKGLSQMGVNCQLVERKPQKLDGGNCFQVPSWFEIVAQDKKLIGSAQKRRKGFLLQHGSLLLSQDEAVIRDLFGHDSEEELNSITLSQLKKDLPGRTEIEQIMAQGFKDHFDWGFEEQSLTDEELESVREVEKRYLSRDWTYLR